MATLQKKNVKGNTYWQIVESRRVNGKPRPIVLMHLGTASALFERLKKGNGKPVKAKVFEYGTVAALWNIAKELDIVGTIDRHVQKRDQGLTCGQYMLLAAINRCVGASSKLAFYDWYRQTALYRILPIQKSLLTSQRFWDHMCYLDEETINHIEEEWSSKLIRQYNIPLQTLLFDATNFDTFIDTQNQCELPQRGHAKSKRADLRIIGLAMLVSTDCHIPMLSHVYAGNQNDKVMFREVIKSLTNRYAQFSKATDDITLVFDGGNVSKDNMIELEESRYHYITSLTTTHHKDLLAIPLRRFQTFSEARLEGTSAYRTTKEIWEQEQTVVVTRSETLLKGQLAGIYKLLKKRRKQLYELRSKLYRSQKPRAKGKGYTRESLDKHLETLTAGQYIAEILKTRMNRSMKKPDFTFWTDRSALERLIQTRLGKRILCTDNHSWSTEKIILSSRAQYHVENAFKQMKNSHWVKFSPAFHWTDQKLRVHCFYTVLALLLSALLQRNVKQAGIPITINALYQQLAGIKEIVNLYTPAHNHTRGRLKAEYVLSARSPLQEKLSKVLKIDQFKRS